MASLMKAPAARLGRNLSTSSRRSREERHDEFISYLERHYHNGLDGCNNPAKFVSPIVLKRYWEQPGEPRISRALSTRGCPPVSTICNGYLTIFSILVYISRPGSIGEFTKRGWQDQQLPLLDNDRRRFGDDPDMTEMLQDFCTNQWRFCPVIFSRQTRMDERMLDSRRILPIESQKELGPQLSNPKSIIRQVKLYDDCCDQQWCRRSIIVLKEYQTLKNEVYRDSWLQEYNSFVSIESFDTIIKYLGSFQQNGRCFIALEYANGGSLQDLFEKDVRPKTPQEVLYFWKALMGLFKAINHIHNLGPRGEVDRAAFAHRDICPANILVFQDDREPFSESFKLKLADFDTATATQAIDESKLGSQDNNGSRTYSAPEASRFYREQETNLKQVPFNCDVWSLGCVLSVALVWLSGGMAAVEAAQRDRKDTIKANHQQIVDSGYDACFHDGRNVLPCVTESHAAALNTLQPSDAFSRGVRDLIEKHILVPTGPKGDRRDAMDIWDEFNKIIRTTPLTSQAEGISGPANSASPPMQHPPSIHINGVSFNPHQSTETQTQASASNTLAANFGESIWPSLTVNDVDSYRRFGTKKENLPGYQTFRRGIQPRHFILIIDDSQSMRGKGTEVCKTAEALLWVLKEIDSEGVEVRFTSDPNKRYPSKWSLGRQKTKSLMKIIWERFKGNDFVPWCNMELALNSIFRDPVVDPTRPTSVLILTDGIWEPGVNLNSGVQDTLLSVVNLMNERRMRRTAFSIQFVSFGNDEAGIKRLRYLDDELPKTHKDRCHMDIVDHKRSSDNFWAILWGAVSEFNDAIAPSVSSQNGYDHY